MSALSRTLRWKEWIPLVSQQQRLRNLIQVIAYNLKEVKESSTATKGLFYYTLHLTSMSAPFYTSEKLQSEHPKWAELDVSHQYGAACGLKEQFKNIVLKSPTEENLKGQVPTKRGMVLRVWVHRDGSDCEVTVWGIYLSGLVYLGPRLLYTDPSTFAANTILFHMLGGYFTAPHCFNEQPHLPTARAYIVCLSPAEVRSSYSVNMLCRLHRMQQAIKKQSAKATALREQISSGGLGTMAGNSLSGGESAVLRRLLGRGRPKPQRQQVLRVKKEIEVVRFRVQLLMQEKERKLVELRKLASAKDQLSEANQDRGCELMGRYQLLNKEVERLRVWKKFIIDSRESFTLAKSQMLFRRRQLIAELNCIYPIIEKTAGKFTICGVGLPNSEDFLGNDEVMVSVALGFAAHLVQMVAYFLHVPLRYPIRHFGSRSKIIDHITDKIPDKEREFPLFSHGKEKIQFNYGVYLLNKNIAQLRWYCGVTTSDLRATLPNLLALLMLKPIPLPSGVEVAESQSQTQHEQTLSGSSLELIALSPLPVPRLQLAYNHCLSSSLDQGLDLAGRLRKNKARHRTISHVSSEPVLEGEHDRLSIVGSGEAQRRFLEKWVAGGPAPICSDEETQHVYAVNNAHQGPIHSECTNGQEIGL